MAVPGRDPVPLSPVPPLSACPMPQAAAKRAHGGLSCVGLNYNHRMGAKMVHCHGSCCSCNSCNVSYRIANAMFARGVTTIGFLSQPNLSLTKLHISKSRQMFPFLLRVLLTLIVVVKEHFMRSAGVYLYESIVFLIKP